MSACKIIVTRPREQLPQVLNSIRENLQANGLQAEIFGLPLLEIVPFEEPNLGNALYQQLLSTQWLNFVSPNAFLVADQLLKSQGFVWPSHLKLLIVGGGTEKILLQSSLKSCEIIKPSHQDAWDSEGLWQAMLAYQLDWTNQKILIIKGDTGRDWLEHTLLQARASVQTISIYKRQNLKLSDPYWQSFLSMWQSLSNEKAKANSSKEIESNERLIWVISSSLACQYLELSLQQLNIKEAVFSQSIAFVTHENIAKSAKAIGFANIESILPSQESIEMNIRHWINKFV